MSFGDPASRFPFWGDGGQPYHVEKAEVLLLLGTTMQSEVFSNYVRYYNGHNLIIIHKEEHYMDHKADLVIVEEPGNVLCQLGY